MNFSEECDVFYVNNKLMASYTGMEECEDIDN